MSPATKTTSSIGSRRLRAGFTFFEVMATAVILAVGIAMIYRGMLLAVDRREGLSARIYADHLLAQACDVLAEEYRSSGTSPVFADGWEQEARLDGRPWRFRLGVAVQEAVDWSGLLRADLVLAWRDGVMERRLSRRLYLHTSVPEEARGGKPIVAGRRRWLLRGRR